MVFVTELMCLCDVEYQHFGTYCINFQISVVDLRIDTVSKLRVGMRKTMIEAAVGDDVMGKIQQSMVCK